MGLVVFSRSFGSPQGQAAGWLRQKILQLAGSFPALHQHGVRNSLFLKKKA
jgi:hypothetical protein